MTFAEHNISPCCSIVNMAKTPDSSPSLWLDIKIELFAAMKSFCFQKYKEKSLIALLLHRARDRGIKVDIGTDIWIEPNHPEWFDDCKLIRWATILCLGRPANGQSS